ASADGGRAGGSPAGGARKTGRPLAAGSPAAPPCRRRERSAHRGSAATAPRRAPREGSRSSGGKTGSAGLSAIRRQVFLPVPCVAFAHLPRCRGRVRGTLSQRPERVL